MATFVGNFNSEFDFALLLDAIKNIEGDVVRTDTHSEKFSHIIDCWIKSNYNLNNIQWIDYYSGVHFNEQISEHFGLIFKVKPVKVWITKIFPGNHLPYYHEPTLSNDSKMVRFQMFIEDYSIGHFFVMDDITITEYRAGDVYKWNSCYDKHASGNMGFVPKYIFNFLGISDD